MLPLQRQDESAGSGWTSGPWLLRSEHLFLIPGDSPIGYRLPLDSLPWVTPAETDEILEADPVRAVATRCRGASSRSAPKRAWAAAAAARPPRRRRRSRPQPPPRGKSAAGVVRTALCVEPRAGPPARLHAAGRATEDYLELVAAIEGTAAQLKMPVVIEGYAAAARPSAQPLQGHARPRRDRGERPSRRRAGTSWSSRRHDALRRGAPVAARHREVHARRPAHRHRRRQPRRPRRADARRQPVPAPARSAAQPASATGTITRRCRTCSRGLFIGPTSQAPRVDEARNDALYELEIAFDAGRRPRGDAPAVAGRSRLPPPAGRRHRQHAPRRVLHRQALLARDAAAAGSGLVELRAFEMPPHARMSLAQQLLLRALVARFWKTPYTQPLVRWGTALHDRFMLPHFVAQDFERRARRSRQAAAMRSSPTGSRRTSSSASPRIGVGARDGGVHVELRQAIEPWHVLGEEAGRRRHGALRRFVGRAAAGARSRA